MADGDSLIEGTDEWTLVPLPAVIAARLSQPSYHIFSEQNVRGEIFNMHAGDRLDPIAFDGNLLLMPMSGSIGVTLNGVARTISAGSQILINPRITFSLEAIEACALELLWMPPFAKVTRANEGNET